MDSLISSLKNHIIEASKDPSFIHHDWFVKYHLDFVERISLELCDLYPTADRNLVLALVWIHDYAKILDASRQHEPAMFEKSREKMLELGFDKGFTDKAVEYLGIFEKKLEIDLHEAPIEVKIASSADAASHLIGPFWSLYYRENPTKTPEQFTQSNREKLKKDWDRKVVLPEIKKAFEARHHFVWEQAGNFPEKFL
jgi:hypothetical protein